MNMVKVRRDDLRLVVETLFDRLVYEGYGWELTDACQRLEAALDAPMYDPATDDHVVSIEFDVEALNGDEDDPNGPANK